MFSRETDVRLTNEKDMSESIRRAKRLTASLGAEPLTVLRSPDPLCPNVQTFGVAIL